MLNYITSSLLQEEDFCILHKNEKKNTTLSDLSIGFRYFLKLIKKVI